MATIASLAGFLIFAPTSDVESDSNRATSCPVFIQIERNNGANGGSLEFRVQSVDGGSVLLAGTPTTGDTVTITVNGNPVSYTLVSGDQTGGVNTTASHVAVALNANAAFAALFTASATGASGVVSIVANEPGAMEDVTLAASTTGGHTTATASGATLTQVNPLDALTNNAACTVSITQP